MNAFPDKESLKTQVSIQNKTNASSESHSQPISIPIRRHQSMGSSLFQTAASHSVKETTTLTRVIHDETGRKMINQYILLQELGRGFHGKVKLVLDTDDDTYWAMKIVNKLPPKRFIGAMSLTQRIAMVDSMRNGTNVNPYMEKIRREIAILKNCDHPNIVKLREVIDDPRAKKMYLVLEYLEGGEIIWQKETKSGNMGPMLALDQSREVFRDLVNGISYLHNQGIIHRDIKPANLLWTKNKIIKISDFGVSVIYVEDDEATESELAKAAGSPAFLAPELCGISDDVSLNSREEHGIDPFAIDIWAMGVTLFCLIFGQVPFTGENEFEVFHNINNQILQFPQIIESNLKDLLQKMLDKNPISRMKLPEIRTHKWVISGFSQMELETWLNCSHPLISVSKKEIDEALTIVGRIRKGFKKLSKKLFSSRYTKRAASMPLIDFDRRVSSRETEASDSPPPLIPYLPLNVIQKVESIKKNEKDKIFKAQEQNSIVTDLHDSPWTAWSDENDSTIDTSPHVAELDQIQNWTNSLSMNDQDISSSNL